MQHCCIYTCQMKSKLIKADFWGMLISGLCLIHCIATPFLFIAKTCSKTCCHDTPTWWKTIDFIFLGIALLAVFESSKKTSKNTLKFGLWLSWFFLAIVIINEHLAFIEVFDQLIFIPAITLISIHFYSLKYCSCTTKNC